MTVTIRPSRPSDYQLVISVIDDWWNGRHMADMLPRLFFDHFADTCFVAERDGELAGFLVGFISQSRPAQAYIHFSGIHPAERGRGLGRRLYERFFEAARARDCELVRAVTSPVNTGSVMFHRRMGFAVEPGDAQVDGIPVTAGYDGAGQDRVRFVRRLGVTDQPDFGTMRLPDAAHVVAPDGSDVRILLRLGRRGGMAHFELGAGRVSRAVAHHTVAEIWYILRGHGQMWRRQAKHEQGEQGEQGEQREQREQTVDLSPRVCVSIPAGTHFQFRAGSDGPLAAIGVTMPPWPGADEAYEVPGAWPADP